MCAEGLAIGLIDVQIGFKLNIKALGLSKCFMDIELSGWGGGFAVVAGLPWNTLSNRDESAIYARSQGRIRQN